MYLIGHLSTSVAEESRHQGYQGTLATTKENGSCRPGPTRSRTLTKKKRELYKANKRSVYEAREREKIVRAGWSGRTARTRAIECRLACWINGRKSTRSKTRIIRSVNVVRESTKISATGGDRAIPAEIRHNTGVTSRQDNGGRQLAAHIRGRIRARPWVLWVGQGRARPSIPQFPHRARSLPQSFEFSLLCMSVVWQTSARTISLPTIFHRTRSSEAVSAR
ncbi:uncharacterized protein LOC120357246 [Solenopsis invicta]|uniref:uncharacterized protein LOC120357246 n=1 Tax=Solenopsis invicta TaxID=13686 RepID=UPI00193D94C0|nr:uncharacterized protein LOC120357246 [Solenopsis invicta]